MPNDKEWNKIDRFTHLFIPQYITATGVLFIWQVCLLISHHMSFCLGNGLDFVGS